MIKEIQNPDEKSAIADHVLGELPEWFGIPESTKHYIEDSRQMPFWAAFEKDEPVGFIALKQTGEATAELYVMGVLSKYHRMGIGKVLYEAFETNARNRGYAYVQVKTVQMGCYPVYDRTNLFYRAMGFRELECFPDLWGESNPCQVYVKYIGG